MNTKETKTEIEKAYASVKEVGDIDGTLRELNETGIFIQTKYGKSVTMFLDDKTKGIIRAIVIPQLEEKREELVKYIDEKLTGGIVK